MQAAHLTPDYSIFSAPIMIVDDNVFNRVFLEKILRSRGFDNLQLIESGEAALCALLQFKPN